MIKKILIVFALFFSVNAFSQLQIAEDSVYAEYDTDKNDVAVHNFHSTSTPIDSIVWRFYSVNVPSTWTNDFFVCDAKNCRTEDVDFFGYNLIDSKSKTLDVHFLNNNNVGLGIAKILVYDYNDSLNTAKIVTYAVNIEEASPINDVENIEVSIFPNPISKYLNINNVDNSIINKIEVYNVIGKKIFQKTDILENNRIDFSAFNKGLYIIKLFDSNNDLIYTKNIIKKHN